MAPKSMPVALYFGALSVLAAGLLLGDGETSQQAF
jgi:hypothetical protein